MTCRIPVCSAPMMSSCRKVGARLGGAENTPPNWVMPSDIDAMVTTRIPIRIAPRTLSASRAAMIKKPPIARRGPDSRKSPRPTSVAGLSTTTPALFNPIRARNMPIPAAIALRNECGMPSTSQRRIPVTVRNRKIMPEMKTAPSACCHEKPIAPTTVKAKKALRPMPGAMPIGQLATSAMTIEPNAAARHVATKTALRSMPVVDRISGLTKIM